MDAWKFAQFYVFLFKIIGAKYFVIMTIAITINKMQVTSR